MRPVIGGHVATLRNAQTDKVRWRDVAAQYVLPLVSAVLLAWPAHVRVADVGQVIAGAAVLAGFSFGLGIFVFQLRMEATRDPRVHTGSYLLELLDELFANVTYAVVVGLLFTALATAAAAIDASGSAWAGVWSGAFIFLGAHYLLTLLMCLKRLRRAYREFTL